VAVSQTKPAPSEAQFAEVLQPGTQTLRPSQYWPAGQSVVVAQRVEAVQVPDARSQNPPAHWLSVVQRPPPPPASGFVPPSRTVGGRSSNPSELQTGQPVSTTPSAPIMPRDCRVMPSLRIATPPFADPIRARRDLVGHDLIAGRV
jgi:hypothetical protein